MKTFPLTLGGVEYQGKLPGVLRRYAIIAEFGEDSGHGQRGAAALAALGLALVEPPCALPSWRDHGGDVFDFGEAVAEALDEHGISISDGMAAGNEVVKRISETFPSQEDVDEATDPTEAPGGPTTPDSPASA